MWDELLTLSHDDFEDYEQYLILQWLDDLGDPDKPDGLPPPPTVKNDLLRLQQGYTEGPHKLPRDQGYQAMGQLAASIHHNHLSPRCEQCT